jgi:hypothetical protein
MRAALKQKDETLKQKENDMMSAIKQKEDEMRIYSQQCEDNARLAQDTFNSALNSKDRLLLSVTLEKDEALRLSSDDYQS